MLSDGRHFELNFNRFLDYSSHMDQLTHKIIIFWVNPASIIKTRQYSTWRKHNPVFLVFVRWSMWRHNKLRYTGNPISNFELIFPVRSFFLIPYYYYFAILLKTLQSCFIHDINAHFVSLYNKTGVPARTLFSTDHGEKVGLFWLAISQSIFFFLIKQELMVIPDIRCQWTRGMSA